MVFVQLGYVCVEVDVTGRLGSGHLHPILMASNSFSCSPNSVTDAVRECSQQ